MKQYGVPATPIGIGSDLLPATFLLLARGLKKLKEIDPETITSITLVHSPEKGSSPTFDWKFLTSYLIDQHGREFRDICTVGV